MRLIKFAGREGAYPIPPQSSGKDNFLDLVTKTSRLPGVDGGFDEYNTRRANQSVGNQDAAFWLKYDPTSPYPGFHDSIRAQRDALGQIAGWGKSRLFMQIHADERQDKRWTWARVSNIRLSENVTTLPNKQIQVQASFQINDPTWRGGQKAIYTDSGHIFDDGWRYEGMLYMDEGHTFDTPGLRYAPVKLEVQATTNTTHTLYNGGMKASKAKLKVIAREAAWTLRSSIRLGDGHYLDAGVDPVSNITITHKQYGKILTKWTWGGTLQPGEELIVDPHTQSVIVQRISGKESGFAQFQRHVGLGFIEAPPGESTITITAGMGTRGCQLSVNFQDAFYTS